MKCALLDQLIVFLCTLCSAAILVSPTSMSCTPSTPRRPASLVQLEPSAMVTGSFQPSTAQSGSQTALRATVSSLPALQVTNESPLLSPVERFHMPCSSAHCVQPPITVQAALTHDSRAHWKHLLLLVRALLSAAVLLCFLPYQ